jgi:hypothetical protein
MLCECKESEGGKIKRIIEMLCDAVRGMHPRPEDIHHHNPLCVRVCAHVCFV